MGLKINPGLLARITGVLFAATAGVVAYNEGYKEVAYQDSAKVWTICYGETEGVKQGDTATRAECDAQLRKSIVKHAQGLAGIPEGIPDVVLIGSLDMAYNIGVYGFQNSTQRKHLLLRNYKAAGEAVLAWRYISQKKAPAPQKGWEYDRSARVWRFDCSQFIDGKRNRVCWGLWERRVWQSKAIGNEFKSVDEALKALPR